MSPASNSSSSSTVFLLPTRHSRSPPPPWRPAIVISGAALSLPSVTTFRDVAFDWSSRFPIARWAPIPLRLIIGYGFLHHGVAKLSRGPDGFVTILHALGVP